MTHKSIPYQPAPKHRHLLTIDQVAGFLAVSPKTVRRMIKDNRLPYHRISGSVRVSSADLDAFIAISRNT
jgi:excisionase family DNA binding protein